MAKVCIVVRNTVVKDRRTITEAQILARFGLHVVVVGLWSKGLPLEEERDGFRIRRIPSAAHTLATSWISKYRRLSKTIPRALGQLLREADPFVSTIIRKLARMLNKPLTYFFLTSAALREEGDYYHAHFPLTLMSLAWLASILLRRPFIRDYNDIIVLTAGDESDPYYEQESLWGKDLNEREIVRIEDIIGAIPPEVDSVLDVGCGDGRITNKLVCSYTYVVGLDVSSAALQHVRAEAVLGSAENLPFEDRSFDLVLTAEVLEHLPDSVYKRARKEIQRVAKKWILVSVPWKEQLGLSRARCPCCGTVFHVNYHCRSFSERRLTRLFAPMFRMTLLKPTGGTRRSYVNGLLWVKQHIGGSWTRTSTTVCPKCFAPLYPGGFPEQNAVIKLCNEWNDKIIARKAPQKSHVIALYQRERGKHG
jgi:SAM-dependent methyltransferase